MASTFLKWFLPAVVTVVAGTAMALSATGSDMTADLANRTNAALGADAEWARVVIDGRDATLTGIVTDQVEAARAVAMIASVPGIRTVESEVTVAERASPYPFSASIDATGISLSGGYPSEDIHKALLSDSGAATDHLRLLVGAPDPAAYTAATTFALDTLKQLDHGYVQLADLSLTISGSARSAEAYDALESLPAHLPAGLTLASLTVTAPVATPYTWRASFDGTRLTVTGNAPSGDLAAQLRAEVPPTILTDIQLQVASGDPSGFSANALTLLKSLLSLESGDASITDGGIALSGAPATAEIASDVTAGVQGIGGTASLQAPGVAGFGLSIMKSATGLGFDGTVPDKATRDRLAALPDAEISGLAVARGAPPQFSDDLRFALAAVSHLESGQVDLKGDHLSIGGVAASASDFKALTAMLATPPDGTSVVAGDLRGPTVTPFLWSANKVADGTVSVAGYVPDAAAKATILSQIAHPGADQSEPAGGAPAGFVSSASKGLAILALLDTGKLAFDGATWSIEGAVDTAQKGFAADAAYSVAGLRTAGWTYDVHAPALPSVTPYIWRARKTPDGAITMTGYAPDEAFQQTVKSQLPRLTDSTTLASGAPADFASGATAGLTALAALQEGSLDLDGSQWTIAGTVADAATRDEIAGKLTATVQQANWTLAIQTQDAAPVVTPYLWSATKTADGSLALAGYVPIVTLKSDMAAHGGKIATDTTSVAAGAPDGFADHVLAALDALAHLSDGRAMFDGNKWSLTGDVASQGEGASAVAALASGPAGGSPWSVTLNGYTPSAVTAVESSPTQSSSSVSTPDVTSIAPLEPPSSSSAPEPSSSSSSAAAPSSSASSPSEMAASSAIESSSASIMSSSAASSAPSESSSSISSASLPVQSSSSASSSSSEEPASSSMEPAPAMPATLTFSATLDASGKVTLTGGVPSKADVTAIAKAAGADKGGLKPVTGLPDAFTADAKAGLGGLLQLAQGQLGFDGSRWYLEGKATTAASRDGITAAIQALPDGASWSVSLELLPPLEACRARVAALQRKNLIQFTGKATLAKTSAPALDALAADLAICPDTDVHVQGHTDSDGDAIANLTISVMRAEAVIDALVQRGADEGRFYAEGFGESDPIAKEDSKTGKAANRRITFEIDAR